MASQEQIPCSLPDTQNADAVIQSQEVLSQDPTLVVWGRLCPKRIPLKSLGKDFISLQADRTNTFNNETYVSASREILFYLQNMFYFTEMVKESYTMGRSTSCDLILTSNEIQLRWLNIISKVHFRIVRERIKNSNEFVIYLEDMSHNGTFVDKVKVGRGNRVIIENNSEIAVAQKNFSSNCTL